MELARFDGTPSQETTNKAPLLPLHNTLTQLETLSMSQDCLSESATKDLVNLLVTRGYFHRNVHGAAEIANVDRTSKHVSKFSETNLDCQIVSTKDGYIITKEQLRVRLLEELTSVGGRLSVDAAATVLAVDPVYIPQVSTDCIRVGDDLIIEEYLDQRAEITNVELVKQDGHVVVSELATAVWNMPMDLVLNALESRTKCGMVQANIMSLSGISVLVTPAFEEREKRRIRGAFQAITLPTQVRSSK